MPNSDQRKESFNNSKLSSALAEKIMNGQTGARNEFIQINYKWLLFIVRRKFTRSNNQEDIVQDTFMLVTTKLQQGKIQNIKAITAFLRTTAINIGFEYLRKDKKYVSALDQELLNEIKSAQKGVLSNIIWKNKVNFVKQIISELTVQRDKDILNQFYFKDTDKKTICQNLDLSTEHFDRVLYRAKARLRQLIDHSDNNPNKPLSKDIPKQSNKDNKSKSNNIILKVLHYFKSQIFMEINIMRFYA